MQEMLRFFLTVAFYVFVLFGAAVLLSGCQSTKYYECVLRDATNNPCNWF